MNKIITKTRRFTVAMLCLVVVGLFIAYSCEKPDTPPETGGGQDTIIVEPDSNLPLENTRWRLVGIVDVKTGNMEVLEPEDCLGCYVLALRIDTSDLGVIDTIAAFRAASANAYWGHCEINYEANKIKVFDIMSMFWTYETGIYLDIMYSELCKTQSFSSRENEFKWYYNNKKNYLLFKRIEL